jgi:integrase
VSIRDAEEETAMDMTVTGIGSVVVAELRAAGYMESTIGNYEKSIRALTQLADGRGGKYTPALGAEFAAMTISPRTGRFSVQRRFDYGRLVRVFNSYVTTGRVELACCTRGGGGPRPVSREFVRLVGAWEADMADRALASATRDAYGRVARDYLVFLEAGGIRRLRDADGASVLSYLNSLTATWKTSSLFWVVSNFRPFLKFTGRSDLVDALGLAGLKRSHRIVPALPDEAQRLIVQACATPAIPARDAAITLLAVTTGLRACDIISLLRDDIDWRARTASLVQQKTHNPLTVPLTDLVVDRLAEYVLDQRPDSPDEHLFVRSVAPHTRLADHATVHRVITTVFRRAGVADVLGSTRLLRHNAATRLLRASVPLPTIAAVLGHARPKSTDLYLSVDVVRLLDCVLDVPAGARP